MQKSKNATIVIMIIILLFGLLGSIKLIRDINVIYLYIIHPIFWIGLSILLHYALGKNIENRKLKKPIMEYTIIATLVYILVYMLSGLFVTFGKNPYNTTPIGLLHNLWIFGTILIAKEYVRYKLINNVYEKDKTKMAMIITVIYVIIDIEITRFIGANITVFSVVKYGIQIVMPNIAKNVLFSYIAINGNYMASMIYQLITNLYFWISPILPNAPWVMTAIIDITIPVILFLYIRFVKNKLNILRNKENIINSDPRNIIPLVVAIILAIWFAVGIFPIKPVAIASGSMEPELYIGDVVMIQKCNANDVNVGDIIEYQMDGYTIIHRIIEKTQRKGEYYFITKGDSNNSEDIEEVRENQLIGKVIFKIRYLGYPAIWLHIVEENEQMIEVETGNPRNANK